MGIEILVPRACRFLGHVVLKRAAVFQLFLVTSTYRYAWAYEVQTVVCSPNPSLAMLRFSKVFQVEKK